MASCSKTSNPYHYCNYNEQEQDQDEYRRRNNSSGFLHDYPSHHFHHPRGYVQTSNDLQFLSNGTNPNQVQVLSLEEGYPLGLTLSISESLIKKIELSLAQEEQQNNHQAVLSQPQPPQKLKASNLPALFLRIGSWRWESKNQGDLVVKFYYGKKKLVWEFLFGSMKKKIEIRWTQVSAINAYVDEDKKERLEIELGDPPEYYKECKFQRLKHTQWEKTDDFTRGEAQCCRRHTILFSPGVLLDHEPFKMLLQYDNRLFNLTQHPFPVHNSQFFNPNMEFPYDERVCRYPPVPLSSYDHQGIVVPSVQNLLQPTSYSVGHSGSNLSVSADPTFPNTNEIARDVSYANERSNSVWEQSGNNQIQDIPIGEQDDYEPYKGLESIVSDEQLELHHMDNQNLGEVSTDQNCLKVDSTCQAFEQNHQNNSNPFEARTDGSCSSSGVMNYMACIDEDEDVCAFAQLQFNDEEMQEPCYWSSSQYNIHGYNNGYNGGPSP